MQVRVYKCPPDIFCTVVKHMLQKCIVLYADDILLYWTTSSNSDYWYLQSDANTVWYMYWVIYKPFKREVYATGLKKPS